MPPRKVYGKRANKGTTAFSNLLSQDKEEMLPQNTKESQKVVLAENEERVVANSAVDTWERQLEGLDVRDGADTRKAKNKSKVVPVKKEQSTMADRVEDLERRLEELGVLDETTQQNKPVLETKTKSTLADPVEALERQLEDLDVRDDAKPEMGVKPEPETETARVTALTLNTGRKEERRVLRAADPNTKSQKTIGGMRAQGLVEKVVRESPRRIAPQQVTPPPEVGNGVRLMDLDKPNRMTPTKIIPRLMTPEDTEESKSSDSSRPTPPRRRISPKVVIPQSAPFPAPAPRRIKREPKPDPVPQDIYTAHVSPLLKLSNYSFIKQFNDWSSELDPDFTVSKIAEASYGEVYRLTLKPAASGRTGLTRADESVLKVVQIKPPPNAPIATVPAGRSKRGKGNAEMQARLQADKEEKENWMSSVQLVHGEVNLLQHLTSIPGFTNFRELLILQGRPSTSFVQAWKSWNKSRDKAHKSIFPDPSKKSSYDDAQLWAVIEMQDAGIDLERLIEQGGMGSIWEVWDVFWGVAISVAKGEEGVKFEHRDLHLGNICIRSRTRDTSLVEPRITISDLHQKLGFTGLETTLIDYGLCRADLVDADELGGEQREGGEEVEKRHLPTPPPEVPEPEVAYQDLDGDPAVFEGDATQEHQYEIYRFMRAIAYFGDPLKPQPPFACNQQNQLQQPEPDIPLRSPRKAPVKEEVPQTDVWRYYLPKTNLIWLHFLLHKLFQYLTLPSESTPRAIRSRVQIREDIDQKKLHRKATKLEKVLKTVRGMLEPEELGKAGSLGSAGELVLMAVGEGWLRGEDVNDWGC